MRDRPHESTASVIRVGQTSYAANQCAVVAVTLTQCKLFQAFITTRSRWSREPRLPRSSIHCPLSGLLRETDAGLVLPPPPVVSCRTTTAVRTQLQLRSVGVETPSETSVCASPEITKEG